jgi:hypothetical protein
MGVPKQFFIAVPETQMGAIKSQESVRIQESVAKVAAPLTDKTNVSK